MEYIITYIFIWVIWYGVELAAWQDSFPLCKNNSYKEDIRNAVLVASVWPISAPVTIILVVFKLGKLRFHGIKFH